MVYKDANKQLLAAIGWEWYNHGDIEWDKFITLLDIGLKFKGKGEFNCDIYTITDHKKWMLACLKYGIES